MSDRAREMDQLLNISPKTQYHATADAGETKHSHQSTHPGTTNLAGTAKPALAMTLAEYQARNAVK